MINNIEVNPDETYNYRETILGYRYAQKSSGHFFYPRDKKGNEYMNEDLSFIEENGTIIYPQTKRGKPRYTRVNGKEVYEMMDGKWIIGTGIDGVQYYAVDQNGDEYYPEDNTPAKMADGTFYYASTKSGISIFPKNDFGNEYYFGRIDLTKPTTIPSKYAKLKSGKEIYPLILTVDNAEQQFLINNTYARDENNKPYYPKDGYNNEYYRAPTSKNNQVLLDRYAITNDQKIILPTFNNKFNIYPNILPKVETKNIIGRLIRIDDIATDYLTNLTYDIPINNVKLYKYRCLLTNQIKLVMPKQSTMNFLGIIQTNVPWYKRGCFWILVIVIIIIKLLLIWWFFFQKSIDLPINKINK